MYNVEGNRYNKEVGRIKMSKEGRNFRGSLG